MNTPVELPQWVRTMYWGFWVLVGVSVGLWIVVTGVKAVGMWNQRVWMGSEPYRVLVVQKNSSSEELEKISLVSLSPDTQKLVAIKIPTTLHVSTVGGYGTYRVGALLHLGEIEGIGSPGETSFHSGIDK